jgi:hypothetical protein
MTSFPVALVEYWSLHRHVRRQRRQRIGCVTIIHNEVRPDIRADGHAIISH